MIKSLLENIEKKYLFIGGGIIVLFLLIAIMGSCNKKGGGGETKPDVANYERIKEIMVKAAEKYYEKNPRLTPKEGSRSNLRVNLLVGENLMQPLETYVKEGVICDGRVIVSNVLNKLYYVPFLDCGKDYREMSLYDTVNRGNQSVTEGPGLYDGYGGIRYFRGEVNNNYVKINNTLWRIMDLDNDKTVRIIYEINTDSKFPNEFRNSYVWDDRYNLEIKKNIGINDFEVSRLNESLNYFYEDQNIVPEELLPKLAKKFICIDKIDPEKLSDEYDCEILSHREYSIATLNYMDYIRASIDEDCNYIQTASCNNYNYLNSFNYDYWTLNASTDSSHRVFKITKHGIKTEDASARVKVRATIYLNDTVIVDSGSGTYNNPYIIK